MLALVAHDNMKRDLAEWVDWNSRKLSRHHLVCTGTTGKMVEKTLRDHREEHEDETEEKPELKITLLKSGCLLYTSVGDKVREITASAMRGEIDFRESFSQRIAVL